MTVLKHLVSFSQTSTQSVGCCCVLISFHKIIIFILIREYIKTKTCEDGEFMCGMRDEVLLDRWGALHSSLATSTSLEQHHQWAKLPSWHMHMKFHTWLCMESHDHMNVMVSEVSQMHEFQSDDKLSLLLWYAWCAYEVACTSKVR